MKVNNDIFRVGDDEGLPLSFGLHIEFVSLHWKIVKKNTNLWKNIFLNTTQKMIKQVYNSYVDLRAP